MHTMTKTEFLAKIYFASSILGTDDMKTSAEVQRDQPPPKQNVMSHERWLRLSDYTCLGRRTSRSVAPSVPGAIKVSVTWGFLLYLLFDKDHIASFPR